MKKWNVFIIACGLGFSSCMDLDLSPLSMATNQNWYANEAQFEMSLNDLFRKNVWKTVNEQWTDDVCRRTEVSVYALGSISGQTSDVINMWGDCYRVIGRDNAIIDELKSVADGVLASAKKDQFMGEALFVRACMYSQLVTLFGDVPYCDTTIDIETAFSMGRTSKTEVLQKIYADFDEAIRLLPVSTGAIQRPTQGAALGMKARIALYNEDWDTVIKCTKAIMDLDEYELYPSFRELFLQSTHNTTESLFSIPRSITYGITENKQDYLPRNNGGWGANGPTWDLLAAFLCTDGLPIDESPLFDPHTPFKNRDPRCGETIVEFGSTWLGIEYDPNPETGDYVMDYNKGEEVKNKDNKNNAEYASFNALLQKKGIDESCTENGFKVEHDMIILRYADILLMYAEAMIEKGTIDQTVLDAMNAVRARAYGVDRSATDKYPAITTTAQNKLRTILRTERRMEFAFENLRYFDMLRWRLFDKAFNMKNYGIYQTKDKNMSNLVTPGHWFWGTTPDIDENGCADFKALEKYGVNSLAQRTWDARQYLWPIPTNEIIINENMKQNPGY